MRKYLQAEEQAIRDAEALYIARLKDRQTFCSHATILEYVGSDHGQPIVSRVCEDCGLHAKNKSWSGYPPKALPGRAYKVSWDEYWAAIPFKEAKDKS